ncbi:MAG: NAD(P)H-binding protein, partial [Melioribacteraceae bacterium]|nr:NAD(P)H-binding protein [Melioribacteraceae bacterium]
MKILLTGVTGYIGKRLLPNLLEEGHEIVCLVRDPRRFNENYRNEKKITIIQADLLNRESLEVIPQNIDIAYYFVHSMGSSSSGFSALETESAENFVSAINATKTKQIIYLSGIINNDNTLSKHLSSRLNVEKILTGANAKTTILRAAIIIGSGSGSFEIIRDLAEKLPIMITPKWLKTKCQPIAVKNVIEYLIGVISKEEAYDRIFDIGGPDILTYKEMIEAYAKIRGLGRLIITVPVLTP